MIEPGPTGNYGACGIGRNGMDATYSAALWRDNPTAFWLHPEGPLADSTPGEFFKPAGFADVINHSLWQLVSPYANAYQSSPQYAEQYALAMQDIHRRYAGTRRTFDGLL